MTTALSIINESASKTSFMPFIFLQDERMCGRFTQKRPVTDYASVFRTKRPLMEWFPRYNLAPGQQALVILKPDSEEKPEIRRFFWGLIPHWAKERGKYATINARIETVEEKPAFRDAFRHRRCIIPVDGYFEWENADGSKRPWYFHKPDDTPLALAGLWDTWSDPQQHEQNPIFSFTIIVRPATGEIHDIHDRMPAILPEEIWNQWLDPVGSKERKVMKDRLLSEALEPLEWYPVGRMVNAAQIDIPDLIAPLNSDTPFA